MRRSRIRKEDIVNTLVFLGASYLAVDFFHLQVSTLAALKSAAPIIIISGLAGLKIKDYANKHLGKTTRRRVSRGYRRRISVKEKIKLVPIAIVLLLILSVVIEQNSTLRPYTAVQNAIAQLTSGMGTQVQAYSGSDETSYTSTGFDESDVQVRSGSSSEIFGDELTQNLTIEQQNMANQIRPVFGANGNEAIRVAICESRLSPTAIGDEGIMFTDPNTGERIGDSIGLFQIRTGFIRKDGTVANRASEQNMTAEQFRTWLQNPVNNINYAYQMFLQRGWQDWSCKP